MTGETEMISTLSGGSNAWPSAACGQSASSASSTGNLAQLETQLFARIDTNGNGSISQSELTNFLNTLTSAKQSASPGANASSLLNALDTSGAGGISLQSFQSNIGTFLSALRSQLATTNSPMMSPAVGGAQPRHHGHGHGGVNALLAALQQATSGTSSTGSTGAASTGTVASTALSVIA